MYNEYELIEDYMKEVIRIWVYGNEEGLKYPDAKPSPTNQPVVKRVFGDFKYFLVDGKNAEQVTRKYAERYKKETGREIETRRGYPSFMFDLGYRV